MALRSLSYACRALYFASTPYIYRGIAIEIDLPGDLEDAKTWLLSENYISKKLLQHVRLLQVRGFDEIKRRGDPFYASPLLPRRKKGFTRFLSHEEMNPELFIERVPRHRASKISTIIEDRIAWIPLLHILSKLRRLTDFTYMGTSLSGRFPPGLVGALSVYHPTCRIWLKNFKFFSEDKCRMEEEELALISCPNLHFINLKDSDHRSQEAKDVNGEALFRTLVSAPNLKHLRTINTFYKPQFSPNKVVPSVQKTLVGMHSVPNSTISTPQAVLLESLSLSGYYILAKNTIPELVSFLNFRALIGLSLDHFTTEDILVLSRLAEMQNVKTLKMQFQKEDGEELFEDNVREFFGVFRSLEDLWMKGYNIRDLVPAISEKCYNTLRSLDLVPRISIQSGKKSYIPLEDIKVLATQCCHLNQLRIPIRRSKSDFKEVEIYRALRNAPNLTNLSLTLHHHLEGDMLEPLPEWDELQRTVVSFELSPCDILDLCIGHIEDAFVNKALDESLAFSIWNEITGKKERSHLKCLELASEHKLFGYFDSTEAYAICKSIARTYRIELLNSGVLTIEEPGLKLREDAEKHQQIFEDPSWRTTASFKVFKRLWPKAENNADWTKVWHSWPLQTAEV